MQVYIVLIALIVSFDQLELLHKNYFRAFMFVYKKTEFSSKFGSYDVNRKKI